MLLILLVSSFAMAGDFESLRSQSEQYYRSEAYKSKVRSQEAAADAEALRKFNEKTLSDAKVFANALHKGLLGDLKYKYNDRGVIVDVDIRCGDGFDCRCHQGGWRLNCDCIHRVTLKARRLEFRQIPAPIERAVYWDPSKD